MKLLRIPQVAVAWTFNIVAIAIMAVGIILRIVAEWVYGSAPYEEPKFYTQEGELTAEDIERLIEQYEDEVELDEDKKVH